MNRDRTPLSPAEVRWQVMKTAFQRPLTVYPATLALLAALFALAVSSGPVVLALIAAGAGFALGNGFWQSVVRGRRNASDVMRRYADRLEGERLRAIAKLRADLEENGDDAGLQQIRLFNDKFRNFVDVLNRKLKPTELTYNRFLGIAEQVFLAGLDNLEAASLAHKSVSAVDIDHIDGELVRLAAEQDAASRQRVAELQTRKTLRAEQLARVEQIKLDNEAALTQLDRVTAEIAGIDTARTRADVDLEAAMNELGRLIARADAYSK